MDCTMQTNQQRAQWLDFPTEMTMVNNSNQNTNTHTLEIIHELTCSQTHMRAYRSPIDTIINSSLLIIRFINVGRKRWPDRANRALTARSRAFTCTHHKYARFFARACWRPSSTGGSLHWCDRVFACMCTPPAQIGVYSCM